MNDVDALSVDVNNANIQPSPPLMQAAMSPKVMNDNRTKCQYDAQCYRKNPDHFKEYSHPQKELKETESVRQKSAKKMEPVIARKEQFVKAAGVNKAKQLKQAQDAYDEMVADAKEKYERMQTE